MPTFTGVDLTGQMLNERFGVCKYKTADESVISSTTYQNDDQLSGWVVAANSVWALELVTVYQASTTGGMKQRFVLPSGASIEGWSFGYDPATADFQAGTPGDGTVTGIAGTGLNVPWYVFGTLFVGSTAGTVDWQWAQNASHATGTILRKGSRCTLRRID